MKTSSTLLHSAVLLALGCIATVPASANLVNNGNFGGVSLPGTYVTVFAGNNTTISGWTVTGGSVDWIGGYWQSPTGPNTGSIDLDGNSPGGVLQTINTTAGQTYNLSFLLSGNPDGGSPTKSVTLNINGSPSVFSPFTYTTGANSHSSMNYVLESLVFIAGPGTTTTIGFVSNDVSSSPYGPVIGGVDVTATPEPTFYGALALGFSGLVYAMRRRLTA